MEKGFLSENNVVYLEDYLRETSFDHLTKKLQKFSQSSDSAMRSVQPSAAKQGQGELWFYVLCIPIVSF